MKRIWYFFIEHFRFTYIVLLTILLLGAAAIYSMPKESNPEVIVPVGVVTTIYPGASALDVEELVTSEIEEEIDELDDLDTYTSTSSEGVSSIVVNFLASSDIDDRIRALKDAVDDALVDLPEDVERPFVNQISFEDEPIMILSFTVDADDRELKIISETIQDELETITGVSEAKVVGTRDREIQITVDQSQLELYELSLNDVVNAIQRQDAQLPVGSIEQNNRSYTVRFEGGLKDELSSLSTVPVTSIGDQPLLLKDVAKVTDGFERRSTISRLSQNGSPAMQSLSIEIFKESGDDIITLVDAVEVKLDEMANTVLQGAEIVVNYNEGDIIKTDLSNLINSGLQTIIIVFLILMYFLGFREASLAGLSIPITFIMSFIGLSALGYTINFLTLFALILSLGILVDATIVIVEGMHYHTSIGKTPKEAAKATIDEFQWPVIAGIMTSVSAFIPMMFASGVVGQFIRTIPVTVITVLLSSLFVAMAIIPVIGTRLLKEKEAVHGGSENKVVAKVDFIQRFADRYIKWLGNFLEHQKHQRLFFTGLAAAFIASVSLPFIGVLNAVLFPAFDDDRFFIDLEAPVGTVLEETDKVTKQVEEMLYQDQEVVAFITSVGSAGGQSTGGSQTSSHIARFTVNLTDQDDRDITSYEIVDNYRNQLAGITGADITVRQNDAGPPTGAPVEITFVGANIDVLDDLVERGMEVLRSTEGATGVEKSTDEAPLEFAFSIDRARAAQFGVTPSEIAGAIRTAVFGTTATSLKIDGEDIDVVVQLNLNRQNDGDPHKTQQTSITQLEQFMIPTQKGRIPLASVLTTRIQSGTNAVQHEDGERVSKITSYVKPDYTTQEVIQSFQEKEDELELPAGYRVEFGGESEDVNQSFADLFSAMIIAVFLIAAILVLQFNSFRQPMFIMASLPFALIGVLPGLTITQQPLSFPAFIGIVALVGIVVNDAIILIDQVNVNRREGMDRLKAVVSGAASRLQPIILTTMTTVMGILPLTLSDPTWGPLGFSVIFGLTFSTVLTLIVVPLFYYRYAEEDVR